MQLESFFPEIATNLEEANRLFKIGADMKYTPSMILFGLLRVCGVGGNQDVEEGFKVLKQVWLNLEQSKIMRYSMCIFKYQSTMNRKRDT